MKFEEFTSLGQDGASVDTGIMLLGEEAGPAWKMEGKVAKAVKEGGGRCDRKWLHKQDRLRFSSTLPGNDH